MKAKFYPQIILFFIFILGLFISAYPSQTVHFTEDNGTIKFTLYATMHSPKGIIHKFKGHFTWDEHKGFSSTTGTLIIPSASLDTKNKARDKKMYEFSLETTDYPQINFMLDSVNRIPSTYTLSSSFTVELAGRMKIKNVTQAIQIPANLTITPENIQISGTYRLNWKDYNVNDPSNLLLKLNKIMKIDWNISIPHKSPNHINNASL